MEKYLKNWNMEFSALNDIGLSGVNRIATTTDIFEKPSNTPRFRSFHIPLDEMEWLQVDLRSNSARNFQKIV